MEESGGYLRKGLRDEGLRYRLRVASFLKQPRHSFIRLFYKIKVMSSYEQVMKKAVSTQAFHDAHICGGVGCSRNGMHNESQNRRKKYLFTSRQKLPGCEQLKHEKKTILRQKNV